MRSACRLVPQVQIDRRHFGLLLETYFILVGIGCSPDQQIDKHRRQSVEIQKAMRFTSQPDLEMRSGIGKACKADKIERINDRTLWEWIFAGTIRSVRSCLLF